MTVQTQEAITNEILSLPHMAEAVKAIQEEPGCNHFYQVTPETRLDRYPTYRCACGAMFWPVSYFYDRARHDGYRYA